MDSVNFYTNVVGLLTGELSGYFTNLSVALSKSLITYSIINIAYMALVILFVYKKAAEGGDFLNLKFVLQVFSFALVLVLINTAIANPVAYVDYVHTIFNYPANAVMGGVSEVLGKRLQDLGKNSDSLAIGTGFISGSLSTLMQTSLNTLLEIVQTIFKSFSVATIGISILNMLVACIFAIFQGGFLLLLMLIVVTTSIEILLWISISVFCLPLLLFKETRGMMANYIKKIISLTAYKPMLFCVAFINYNIIDAAIVSLPKKDEVSSGIFGALYDLLTGNLDNTLSVLAFLLVLTISSFLMFMLVKKIPDFINNIFGVSGGVGDAVSFVSQGATKMAMALGGGGLGAVAAKVAGTNSQAGGGAGGLIAGAANIASGGLFGGAASGVGGMINKGINSSAGGRKMNDAITKGVEFGTSLIKGDK